MATTSRSEQRPAIEFVGGAWCGQQYRPMPGADYPAELHMPHAGRTYLYHVSMVDGRWAYRHVGTLIPDGADIW